MKTTDKSDKTSIKPNKKKNAKREEINVHKMISLEIVERPRHKVRATNESNHFIWWCTTAVSNSVYGNTTKYRKKNQKAKDKNDEVKRKKRRQQPIQSIFDLCGAILSRDVMFD